jgi:hypothetical protein
MVSYDPFTVYRLRDLIALKPFFLSFLMAEVGGATTGAARRRRCSAAHFSFFYRCYHYPTVPVRRRSEGESSYSTVHQILKLFSSYER